MLIMISTFRPTSYILTCADDYHDIYFLTDIIYVFDKFEDNIDNIFIP